MTIQDISTAKVTSCSPDTDLAAVAKIMWDCDCGAVPVVGDDRRLVGMITDRDICIAAATRATIPADIRVRDVMSTKVHACRPQDDVRTVMKTMRDHRVRRVPIVDAQQRLAGIVSVNDLVAHTEFRKDAEVPGDLFIDTMKAICAHQAAPVAV
jgi:CBS domain-containing protein